MAVAATAAVASPVQAASLIGTGISSNGGWAFELKPPTRGQFKSTLFIAEASDKNTSLKDLFVENAFGEPLGLPSITPSTGKNSFTFADGFDPSKTYILGLFTEKNSPAGVTFTLFSDESTGGSFVNLGFVAGKGTLFGWDDTGANNDGDLNDIQFYVRAVPVPGLIPGVALAGAFIVARSRKRKEATKA
ncbi:MAG: hypothetical protein HC919_02880 [Oscillatoriales cyanobacterium SM2_2_1]|nr:hypothetical protein [Oscillatoriales cyanobacterium SM2_2_1]